MGKRGDERSSKPLLQVFPYGDKRRVPEDVEPGRTEQGKLIVRNRMHEPQVHRQSQPGEQTGDLGIIRSHFILEVHLADDVDTPPLRAGPGGPRKGDESIVQTILEGPPEEPGRGDMNDRYPVIPGTHGVYVVTDGVDDAGR